MASCIYLGLMACVLTLMAVALADRDNKDKENEIDKFIKKIGECHKNSSISIAALHYDDRHPTFDYIKGFNPVSPSRRQSTSYATKFCIGGATQAFTAVLLARLMELNNSFNWDTPISRILHMNLGIPDEYTNEKLSLKDILGMRSGLSGMDIVPVAKPFADVDEAIKYIRFAPTVGAFRDSYRDNKVLFAYVDLVLRRVGKDTWANLLRQHILEPLKMADYMFLNSSNDLNSSSTSDTPDGIPYSVDKVNLTKKSYAGLDLIAPAVSLCTSARDMKNWLRFLLDERISKQILSNESLAATFRPISIRPHGEDKVQVEEMENAYQPIKQDDNYSFSRDTASLGWLLGQYRGWPTMFQDGSIPGYQTLVTIIPSKKIAVFVSVMADDGIKSTLVKTLISHHMIDTILDLKSSWLNKIRSDLCSVLNELSNKLLPKSTTRYPAEDITKSKDLQPELYESSYLNYAFGEVKVHRELFEKDKQGDDRNKVENPLYLTYGLKTYELKATTENNTFVMKAKGPGHNYITYTDGNRQRSPLARFRLDDMSKENWVQTVTIEGFEKDVPVEFSTNPEKPHRADSRADSQHCNAAQLTLGSCWLLLLITLVSFLR